MKNEWVVAYGHQYESEEEYKEALQYYVCMNCGGDLPRDPLPNPQLCSHCRAREFPDGDLINKRYYEEYEEGGE